MKIGILGGTFDPPHNGHLTLARAAIEHLGLDEIIFVPANQNPLKDRRIFTKLADRVEMVKLLSSLDEKFAMSDVEITRGGPSYMVDTVTELSFVEPAEYWVIMGADSLKTFEKWKNPFRLTRLARLAVAARPPIEAEKVLSLVDAEYHDRIDLIPFEPMNVSSTEIRDRVLKNLPLGNTIPTKVLQYIQKQKLYKL
jgi:nicotinate-nucleotide adenylyltransferase